MKLPDYTPMAKTRDALLCYGRGFWSARIRNWQKFFGGHLGKDVPTHVAEVIDVEALWEYLTYTGSFALSLFWGEMLGKHGRFVVAESTSIGGKVDGVRFTALAKWLKKYNGKVKVRRMVTERDEEFYREVAKFWYKHRNKPYEKKPVTQLIFSVVDCFGLFKAVKDLASVFCSEILAQLSIKMRMFPKGCVSAEVTPADYMDGSKVDKWMRRGAKVALYMKPERLEI